MTSLKTEKECHSDDPNNVSPMDTESSLNLPLDNSMCIVFTGYFNGLGVEVRSLDEMALLHHMGCFGKGSVSRCKPQILHTNGSPPIMRKRQFAKRNYWAKRFTTVKDIFHLDSFLKEVSDLGSKIVHDTRKQSGRDVIDLVSSDDELEQETDNLHNETEFEMADKQDLVVIVPNSDSEDDNYFANLKPKCCVNKIQLQEKLMLSLEEAFFLLYGLGCLQIVNNVNHILNIEECWHMFTENDAYFIQKYVVYHYFRSKGYVVKPGIKFGGDYLLYRDGPDVNHADYVVLINNGINITDWLSLLGQIRMAATTVKEVLIVEVLKSSKEDLKLPKDLGEFSVRELLYSRNIPNIINDSNDVD